MWMSLLKGRTDRWMKVSGGREAIASLHRLLMCRCKAPQSFKWFLARKKESHSGVMIHVWAEWICPSGGEEKLTQPFINSSTSSLLSTLSEKVIFREHFQRGCMLWSCVEISVIIGYRNPVCVERKGFHVSSGFTSPGKRLSRSKRAELLTT